MLTMCNWKIVYFWMTYPCFDKMYNYIFNYYLAFNLDTVIYVNMYIRFQLTYIGYKRGEKIPPLYIFLLMFRPLISFPLNFIWLTVKFSNLTISSISTFRGRDAVNKDVSGSRCEKKKVWWTEMSVFFNSKFALG